MAKIGGAAGAGMRGTSCANSSVAIDLAFHNVYRFECIGVDGAVKWVDEVTNLVTTAGQNDLLNKYFLGSAYTATWYVGLVSGASPTFAAGDTSASHSGWTEFSAYSQANRPTWTGATSTVDSTSNSASQAVFSINGSGGTVGGAFLISNNTISGATGVLFGEAALGSARTLASGDTLNITVTLTV